MQIIVSTKNRLVKLARSLAQKKFRTETGLFLVEGVNLLRDMPSFIRPEYVFFTENRAEEALSIFDGRISEDAL